MKKTSDVWNEILEKPPSKLSLVEQNVKRTNIFLFEFECGGWLYNLSPASGVGNDWVELRETAKSIGAVGGASVGRQVLRIASIVERLEIQQATVWGEFLSAVSPNGEIEKIEKLITAETEDLWDKLKDYTVRHFKCKRE